MTDQQGAKVPESIATNRELNQMTRQVNRAALAGPVMFTESGRPACVLLKINGYQKLKGSGRNILYALAMTGLSEIEFCRPMIEMKLKVADFG